MNDNKLVLVCLAVSVIGICILFCLLNFMENHGSLIDEAREVATDEEVNECIELGYKGDKTEFTNCLLDLINKNEE